MVDDKHPFLSRIDGKDVSSYLERYAELHGLDTRIRLRTRVTNATKQGQGWKVTIQDGEELYCDKLIISTGLSSEPKYPKIPNIDSGFTGPVMHTCSLGLQHHLLTAPEIKEVVVIGGSKSAIETLCLCVEAGKVVHWLIREDGGGASMMIVTNKDNPGIVALNATRIFNIFSPSIFATSGFWYRFLHSGKNPIGRRLESLYWKNASRVVTSAPKYWKSKNGEVVKPITDSVFWNPNCLSLIDSKGAFLDYLHDDTKVKVQRKTVTHLSRDGVHLADGQVIKANAVVFATGWEKASSFFDDETALDLGIPVDMDKEPTESNLRWQKLYETSANKVKQLLPELANPPRFDLPEPTKTPYRHYRNVIPPNFAARGDTSIAFTGTLVTSQTVTFAELSSLYAVAYLEGMLPSALPSLEKMNEEVALANAWTVCRYGYRGVREPLNLTEQTFFDLLCRDLGIKSHRKRGSRMLLSLDRRLKEWLVPYRSSDYHGLVNEFLNNQSRCGLKIAELEEQKIKMAESKTSSLFKKDIVVCETEIPADRLSPLCHRMGSYFQ